MLPQQEASTVSDLKSLGRKRTHRTIGLRQESDRFWQIWPEPPSAERPMPSFTWEQLERQLADLSGTPAKAAITPPLVSAMRKQAPFMPAEMVLREILCLAWTLMDEAFQPELKPGEEADMP
jgi:hypothetical protein